MTTPDPADRFAPTNTIAAKRADLRNEMRGTIRRVNDPQGKAVLETEAAAFGIDDPLARTRAIYLAQVDLWPLDVHMDLVRAWAHPRRAPPDRHEPASSSPGTPVCIGGQRQGCYPRAEGRIDSLQQRDLARRDRCYGDEAPGEPFPSACTWSSITIGRCADMSASASA